MCLLSEMRTGYFLNKSRRWYSLSQLYPLHRMMKGSNREYQTTVQDRRYFHFIFVHPHRGTNFIGYVIQTDLRLLCAVKCDLLQSQSGTIKRINVAMDDDAAVGRGNALQEVSSRFRFSIMSTGFFTDIILPATL